MSEQLQHAFGVFRKWLGADYETDALAVCLAAKAVERIDGDPLWVLLISGSGNAKTETVTACRTDAVLTSTIRSEGALLSATASKERAKEASGGLLRQLQPRGVLIIKDVTSILSMDRNLRGQVLAALREVYDGSWVRSVGTDGGRQIAWSGRIAIIGAVTTAWDTHHQVIAACGDRFVCLRMDSRMHRRAFGRSAMDGTGSEEMMRRELHIAADDVMDAISTDVVRTDDREGDRLLAAADLVTLARTACEYEFNGNVSSAHAPEMPTRFAKQLGQVFCGAVAIGMDRAEAMRLAIRVARDSMPPLRLEIIDDLAEHPHSSPSEVRKRINKPHNTVDRQLQALHMLRVVDVMEEEILRGDGRFTTRWRYSLAPDIDPSSLTENGHRFHFCESSLLETQDHLSRSRGGVTFVETVACPKCGKPCSHKDLANGYHVACAPQDLFDGKYPKA